MRKKSHISLAKYLIASLDTRELERHKKAFYLGSILPDCKPSFLTKKHQYDGTYEEIQQQIRALTVDPEAPDRKERVYWRRTGEVIHYLADYFTFPHNDNYTGNLREHCQYEKYLKHYMKYYIFSGKAEKNQEKFHHFDTVEAMFAYIEDRHEHYMRRERNIEDDTRYITCLCLQVAYGMYELRQQNRQSEAEAPNAA